MHSFGRTIITALLAAGVAASLAACKQASAPPPPTVQPQQVVPATLVPTVAPTVAPTAAAQAAPLTAEEIQKLRALAYTLANGTTVSPAATPAAGAAKVVIDQASIRKGDLNGDGVEDALVVLVTTSGPQGPQLILAPVISQNGTYVSQGVITLTPDSDITDIAIGNGQVTAKLWQKTADGLGYEVRQVTYQVVDGKPVEVAPSTPMPAPTAAPTDAPAPAAPQITMTLDPEQVTVGQQVDIYVHAFNSPSIVSIELHRDGEKVDEWKSPDPAGVPYQHYTFVWTPTSDGDYELQAIAKDKWGGEGRSDLEKLEVVEPTQ